ncbi:MAG: hypothetical protein NWR72_11980 [Bacteroidia bacterium]|nr:hypothetical protein [Bacteroidia bacterium]
MLTKGLLLGTGLIGWALWRSFWPGELWAEIAGIAGLILWLILVWLTTISRYILLYGNLSLSRILWLGAGMAFSAIAFFSSFLLLQAESTLSASPIFDFSESAIFNKDAYPIIVVSTLGLTMLVGAINWWSGKWGDPNGIDY